MSNEVLLLGHNGLGDHITAIGAIRYLSSIYSSVHYPCKKNNFENVKKILHDISNLVLIPFDENKEGIECEKIVNKKRLENFDIITFGLFNAHYKNKINNKKMLETKLDNKHYKMDQRYFSSKTGGLDPYATVEFIGHFYEHMGLGLSVYYDWFDIKSTKQSEELYNLISKYKIIFTHTKASDKKINLNFALKEFLSSSDYIVVCANENLYSHGEKSNIAKKFVNAPVADYITTILNAEQIHIIDSCFAAMVLPMTKTNKSKASVIKIYDRVR